MFKIKANLSNVRPAKSDKAELSTTPTSGSLKLNALAAREMGILSGDYVNVIEGEVEGETAFYIHKGEKGVGSKAASTGKSGGMLSFSSANVYDLLKGDDTCKKVFTLDVEGVQELEGVKYYKLVFDRTENKIERKAKAEA